MCQLCDSGEPLNPWLGVPTAIRKHLLRGVHWILTAIADSRGLGMQRGTRGCQGEGTSKMALCKGL